MNRVTTAAAVLLIAFTAQARAEGTTTNPAAGSSSWFQFTMDLAKKAWKEQLPQKPFPPEAEQSIQKLAEKAKEEKILQESAPVRGALVLFGTPYSPGDKGGHIAISNGDGTVLTETPTGEYDAKVPEAFIGQRLGWLMPPKASSSSGGQQPGQSQPGSGQPGTGSNTGTGGSPTGGSPTGGSPTGGSPTGGSPTGSNTGSNSPTGNYQPYNPYTNNNTGNNPTGSNTGSNTGDYGTYNPNNPTGNNTGNPGGVITGNGSNGSTTNPDGTYGNPNGTTGDGSSTTGDAALGNGPTSSLGGENGADGQSGASGLNGTDANGTNGSGTNGENGAAGKDGKDKDGKTRDTGATGLGKDKNGQGAGADDKKKKKDDDKSDKLTEAEIQIIARIVKGEVPENAPRECHVAVAAVILNRLKAGGFGKTVAEVAHAQGTNGFTCYSSKFRAKLYDGPVPKYALDAARAAGEANENPIPGCTHYFNPYFERPQWANKMTFVKRLGTMRTNTHDFYKPRTSTVPANPAGPQPQPQPNPAGNPAGPTK